MKKIRGAMVIASFVGAAILANWMTARYGMITLPFGVMTTAGTFAAGVVLIARDAVHEMAGRLAVAACIVAGSLLSGLGAPWQIALASGVAFAVSELTDWAIYTPLREQGRGRAVVLSSLVAAPLDTALFLALAGIPITGEAITGQTVVKVGLAVIAAGVIRAVLRHRVRSARA